MSAKPSETNVKKLFDSPALGMDADALLQDFSHYYSRMLGRGTLQTRSPFVYQALVLTARDRLMERWKKTSQVARKTDGRRVAYLSLEFLMGRLLHNSLLNLGIEDDADEALQRIGLKLEEVETLERDAGLGNGGLGRLAACFLDSCATLGLPVTGYGIRYHYGMFHQKIVDGRQVEEPDLWLQEGFPWEIKRPEYSQHIRFGGFREMYKDAEGKQRYRWSNTHDVLAVPYDVPVPGYKNEVVNTLRLWSASATEEFDLDEFNAGSYSDAVASKNAAENITMVLYPNATTENGQELRLRQQYFLASASLQDILREWCSTHGRNLDQFAEKHCFQLNDTHPAVSVAELMRLLLDDHLLEWDSAWAIVQKTMAYTNHTLLPEALELWPVDMFQRLLPRLMDIIFEINARFIGDIRQKWPGDVERIKRMSLIQEGPEPKIRMAYLAIVGSFSVNGVAQLHSDLLIRGLFKDFYEMWPHKFNNKTNGVTQRRWLAACNPELATLISRKIGDQWVTDLPQLEQLKAYKDEAAFAKKWRAIKVENKQRLADEIKQRSGVVIHTDMLFDVQVKRIHEYKRQLLNVLHAIHLYDRISRGEGEGLVPRAIIIGGKAAPGYVMAKGIIKFINNVAEVINKDPAMDKRLKLVFFADYNVSAMELICPAAELSEQVSTAGKEASGTGNMKFMMNGALTIGTLDGANVEIREAVGEENFFLFGLTVEEVAELRGRYNPKEYIDSDTDFARVMRLIESDHFNAFEPGINDSIINAIRSPRDAWMTAADFRSYVDAQERVNDLYKVQDAWTQMSILNTASSGRFSTDRTMQDYNNDIWHLTPLKLDVD